MRPIQSILPLFFLHPTTSKRTIDLSTYSPQKLKLSDLVDPSRYIPPGAKRTYNPSSPNDSCFAPLHESDLNQDGLLDNEEYLDFVNALAEETGMQWDGRFRDLPFVLKVNFVYLGCLCEGGGNNCCNGEWN